MYIGISYNSVPGSTHSPSPPPLVSGLVWIYRKCSFCGELHFIYYVLKVCCLLCLYVCLSSRIFSWSDLLRTSLLAFKYYYGFAFISVSLYNRFCDELIIDFFFLTIALITNNYIPVTFSLLSFHVISSEISAFNKEFYLHRTSR